MISELAQREILNQFESRCLHLHNIFEREEIEASANRPKAWGQYLLDNHEAIFQTFVSDQPFAFLAQLQVRDQTVQWEYVLLATIQLGFRLSNAHEHLSGYVPNFRENMRKLSFEDQADLLCEAVFHYHYGKGSNWPW